MKDSLQSHIFEHLPGPIGSPGVYWATGILCTFAFAVPLQSIQNIPRLCIFHRLTGVPCPGCGLSRSIVAFTHLDLGQAISFHVFGPLFFLVCLAVFGLSTAQRFFGINIPWKRIGVWSKWPVIVVAIAWLAWAGYRAVVVAMG